MKRTTLIIKTNRYLNGFYRVLVSGFGDNPRFTGQLPSRTIEAVNKIDEFVVGGQHYIDGHYIEIMEMQTEEPI